MDDLISRQAAIASAISGRIRALPTTEDGEDWIRVSEVRESLLNLPSAEPQIVRCGECKHNSLKRVSGNAFCELGHAFSQLYDYCSDGERRTGENG